jgi:hypothetical protein
VTDRVAVDRVAVGRFEVGVDGLRGFDLAFREAIGAVAVLAEERQRIELARARIADEPVFETIALVACRQRRLRNHRELRGRQRMIRILQHRLRHGDALDVAEDPDMGSLAMMPS